MQPPMHDSILKLSWIEFALAQTGLWVYDKTSVDPTVKRTYSKHLASVLYFLGIFVGFWPSRHERSKFSRRRGVFGDDISGYYIQIHFRCFKRIGSGERTVGSDGLLCKRQRGQIMSSAQGGAPLLFEEKRVSIFGLLSGGYDGSNDSDMGPPSGKSYPAMYRILILADQDMECHLDQVEDSELKRRAGLEGTIAFHAAMFAAVSVWESEWNSILDQVNEHLRFQVSQTMNTDEIGKWMFDSDFKRSRVYFTTLQTLRIFEEYIRTFSEDLHALDDLFYMPPEGFAQSNLKNDELLVLRSNWESIIKHHKCAEERLFRRLLDKSKEVTSLRDGVRVTKASTY